MARNKKKCCRCKKEKSLSEFQENGRGGTYYNCKECLYYRRLFAQFGITEVQYLELLQKQKGVCAICKGPEPIRRVLSVDHCHLTGRVRGLLCSHCNHLLGKAKDDVRILKAAIKYLKETE